MSYEIGQILPYDPPRLLADEGGRRWYIFRTPPQRENGAEAWLTAHGGALDAWHPTEQAFRPTNGGKRRKVPYERRIAPGYVFALFDREPVWWRFFDAAKGRLVAVVSHQGQPVELPSSAMARMRMVPKRLEILRDRIAKREIEERLARIPKPGDQARLTQGPMAGHVVEVSAIDRGVAHCIIAVLGKIAVDAEALERVKR